MKSETPQGGHVNHVYFPTMLCVYRGKVAAKGVYVRGRWGAVATPTELFFASGIAMETRALFIESLCCSHSPAVYHSVHMLEADRAI